MYIIVKKVVQLLSLIFFRIKIIGKENIPKEGAAIICSNHIHALDSVVFIPNNKRKINILAKDTLFTSKIGRWLAKIFGVYPIKRDTADMHAIKTSLKILKNNELLMIFPEGTRNGLAKGTPIKNGAVQIAIKAGVPIIPVGIRGTFKIFSKITIHIGKPIYYNNEDRKSDKELITNLTQNLMNEIIKLREL